VSSAFLLAFHLVVRWRHQITSIYAVNLGKSFRAYIECTYLDTLIMFDYKRVLSLKSVFNHRFIRVIEVHRCRQDENIVN